MNLDTRSYSARVGESTSPVCSGVSYAPPTDRYITQPGVETVRYKVPSYRSFNTLMFVPPEGSKETVYLDDVLVKWIPTLHYTKPGKQKLLEANFEKAQAGSTRLGHPGISSTSFVVEKTTSYGPGVHCARATGGGAMTAALKLTAAPAEGAITVDLDVFIRSDKGFPFIIPDPTTRSPHSVALGLAGSQSDQPFALIDSAKGTWRLWDGQDFVDTGKRVTYDVWNHVQLSIDTQARTYRLVVQPVGELPTLIGQAGCGTSLPFGETLKLSIKPSATTGHVSCYDNIVVTRK